MPLKQTTFNCCLDPCSGVQQTRSISVSSLAWPAPKKIHIGAFRKVCSTSLKIGEQRSTDSGINTLTRPQDSQLYLVQASSRPSHRVVRDFPAWLLELGKGRRKWRQDVVEGLCAAWRARAQSRNPPKDSLNGANRFKKNKRAHRHTAPKQLFAFISFCGNWDLGLFS